MFLKGNIGKDGEEGLISNIENSKNTIYLIKKEGENLNWQTPKSVIEYIRKNMKKLGGIEYYDIYCKQQTKMSEKIEKQSFIQLCVFSTEEDLERARKELD